VARDPFLISVSRLRRQLGAVQACAVSGPFDPTGELKAPSPGESDVPEGDEVTFDGTLETIPNGLIASGEVTGRWVGECRRCAEPLKGELATEVRERYLEGVAAGDDEAYPLEGDTIDLGPMIRDAIVLELPLAPLCSQGCKGLCGQCGADLNKDDCGCGDLLDPRWARLDVLRPDQG
jgi:uncharacterized protein